MDRFIRLAADTVDGDLTVGRFVAYQTDMTIRCEYDETYFNKCAGYEGQTIARKINAGRAALVNKYWGGRVCDVGIGCGEFIRARPMTYGTDVNHVALKWLRENGKEAIGDFTAYTFWDVLEHVPKPEEYLDRIPVGGLLFTSIPIFDDLGKIRESKHYRPGEHLYYFTDHGLVSWLALHGFELLERQSFEIEAGRDSIFSYAFRRER